ncbi:MAG: outer membrane lipoprotein carrier protein LolA [bacterium]|nr:outer membrane lipoprotein carrier protein LolA [bacterium]
MSTPKALNRLARFACGWLLLALISPPLWADEMDRLSQRLRQSQKFSAQFIQSSYNRLKDRKITSGGKLAWMRPGLIRFEYLEPEPLLIIVGTDRVWIFDPLLENVTLADKSEVDRLEGLAFLFSSAPLSEAYLSSNKPRFGTEDKGPGWLYLSPKKPVPGLAELHLKPGGGLVESFILFDEQGNWRRFDLKNPQTQPALKPQDFYFEIPEGMEVIDKLSVGH